MRKFSGVVFIIILSLLFLIPACSKKKSNPSAPAVANTNPGGTWQQSTASAVFNVRGGHTSVVYNNEMWVISGAGPGSFYSDIFYSNNGSTWITATVSAAFTARSGHTSVVYNNEMWVIAGFDRTYNFKNDVWNSSDGANWTQATGVNGAAFSARDGHTSVVYNNEMWVIGGCIDSSFDALNDVWNSSDGADWAMVTGNAGFTERYGHSSVIYNNKIWVIGGYGGGLYANDVWYSSDGINWTETTDSAGFGVRNGHTSIVYNNEMWVIGGYQGGSVYLNDVWNSSDGENWTQATTAAEFSVRRFHSSVTYKNEMWVIGGYSYNGADNFYNDVWWAK